MFVSYSAGEYRMSNVECRMSNVECRMSNVECRMSNVECRAISTPRWFLFSQTFFYYFFQSFFPHDTTCHNPFVKLFSRY